ncbi:MAG: CHAD domain-containing protein, partial [Alphaproteobacteria bacterium]|nr:CHAD domain-containing protein [Alphaproteobacteria bacterium]
APVFETQIHRRTWIIEHDGGKAELALDSGRIVAGDKSEKLAEIEIELIDGPPATVIEIAKRLAAELPLAIESRDKAARGYALLKGLAPPPVRAATVALDPGMSAREVFILLARAAFGQVRRNEAAARAGIDIEGVHQMRVGLRRFRALLGVFRKQLAAEPLATLAEELRWLQGNLGPAREWDVFIDETITPLIEKRPQEMGLRALRDAADKARQAAYHRLRRALDSPRYTALVLETEYAIESGALFAGVEAEAATALDGPAIDYARWAIRRRNRKMRDLPSPVEELAEADLHALRLNAKKARYAAEFFRSLFPVKSTKGYIDAVAGIQDHLGALNDAYVSRRLIGALRRGRAKAEVARAEGLVSGWYDARIEADREALPAAWAEFLDAPRFWKRR